MRAARFALLLLCAAAVSSSATSPDDARAIVEKTVNRDQRNYRELQSWTYKVSDRIEKLDSSGRTKSVETTLDEVLYLGGTPFVHALEKNGKPLPSREAAKEQAKLDKATADAGRLTEDQRRKREQETEARREKDREPLKYLPEAYAFRLLGEDVVDGRPAWRISAAPAPDYQGKYGFLLKNLAGTLWIDKEDFQFVKGDIHAIKGFSIGLFFASVAEGAHLYFDNMRLSDGIWVSRRAGFEGSARVLVRRIRQNEELQFSDFRKFQSDSRILPPQP
jgi:hypothetical protein